MKISTVIGDDLKSHYLAFVLDETTRSNLFKLITPKYEKKVCHHVTLKFDMSKGLTKKEASWIGEKLDVQLLDVRDDGKGVQCIAVSVEGETDRPGGSFYHITHSIAADRKPVDSNKLVNLEGESIKGILKIEGRVYLVKK